jgi:hypothetical protein
LAARRERGGKTRSFKKLRIEENILEFEELVGNQDESLRWTAKIFEQDLANLYIVFVENKFDCIKNDQRQGLFIMLVRRQFPSRLKK